MGDLITEARREIAAADRVLDQAERRRSGNRRAEDGPPKFTCPHCGDQISRVVDTRGLIAEEVVRRRRECVTCGARWSTVERFVVGSVILPTEKSA